MEQKNDMSLERKVVKKTKKKQDKIMKSEPNNFESYPIKSQCELAWNLKKKLVVFELSKFAKIDHNDVVPAENK